MNKGWRYPRNPQKRRELAAYLMNVKKFDGILLDAFLGHFRTAFHSIKTQRHIAENYISDADAKQYELDKLQRFEEIITKMRDDESHFKESVDVYLSEMEKMGFHLPPIQRSGDKAQ